MLLKTADDKPALMRRKVGKGRVFLLGFCVQDTYFQMWEDKNATGRAQLRKLIAAITDSCGVFSHVWSSNPEIEAAFMMVLSGEESVQMRMRALDYLAAGKVASGSLDDVLDNLQRDADSALLMRAADFDR